MTEKEKQAAGLPFDGASGELKKLHYNAQKLIRKLNETPVDDEKTKKAIVEELFGRAGKNLRVYLPLRVDFGCNVYTGDNVLINQNCTFLDTNKITIGERVLIAPDVKIYTATHPVRAKERYYDIGGGSIKKNGIYDKVVAALTANGKEIYEDSGVMPNPTVDKLNEGIARAKAAKADLILAVGGGSVCDYAKALSVSVNCGDDPWEKYFIRFEDVTCDTIPVGCVLTMVGTGSEMNGGSVITNRKRKLKIGHVFGENVFPRFSIMNPEFTFTLPKYQMISGIYDIMSHILEQYFSGTDDNTSDYIMEGLLRSLIHSANIAVEHPTDYEARSNIMWIAAWALNTLVAKGKTTDWMVHMIGQAVAAHTDATHGMTLAAVSMPYYRSILPYGTAKFARYAVNVWNVNPEGKTDEQVAYEGLEKMQAWMKKIGLVMNITELGATEAMLDEMVKSTLIMNGGYKVLSKDDIRGVLKASF